MPSVSQKQHDLMVAVSKDEALAEKLNIDQKVAREFVEKDKEEGLWQESDNPEITLETVTVEDADLLRAAVAADDDIAPQPAPFFRMEDRFVGRDEEESE